MMTRLCKQTGHFTYYECKSRLRIKVRFYYYALGINERSLIKDYENDDCIYLKNHEVTRRMDRVRKRVGLEGLTLKEWPCKPVTVAVLDSGMENHPDLVGKCICFQDFVNRKRNCYDDAGHGTHVCGILCGTGEASMGKYRGIAPFSRLIVCKVLDKDGNGDADTMLEALEWLLEHRNRYHIRIINISVGISNMKDKRKEILLTQYLERLWDEGVVVVCAAGNKGPRAGSISNIGGVNKVITVGCYDDLEPLYIGKNCEYYSGRGRKTDVLRKPDLVAPGTAIVSCNHNFSESLYIARSGTSMAAPMVAGAAALLLQRESTLSNNVVADRLRFSAQDLGKPWNRQGWGMLNIKNILEIR